MAAVQYDPDEDLKTFGYQQQLRRSMGGYSSFALAFSMISITTCIFTLFAQPFQMIGGVAIWLWVLATAGILVIAAVYGHLAARLPVTGYAYQWSSRLVNPHYGWFTGWNALLATLFGSASIAIAFGTVFAPDFFANPSHGDVILLASLATVLAVAVNVISMAGSDALQVVAFIAVFSCLLANITVATRTGFSLSRDNMLPASKVWSRVHPATRTPIVTIIAVGAVTVGVNFLSSGEAAKVTAIVAVVCMITYATSMVAVLFANRRGDIPEAGEGRFDLGRWLVPMAVVGLAWSIVVILFMTVPAVNHAAGEYTVYFELAGVAWYFAALRRRLRRGDAGPNLNGSNRDRKLSAVSD